ncbi:MAG: hypothetical protein ABSB69_00140 [Solirubrobacteraceae bacterium]
MSERPTDAARTSLFGVLERLAVHYIVIGGAAAEARGWRGRTLDVDVVPASDPQNLDRLASALNELDARMAGVSDAPDGLRVPGGFDRRLLASSTVWNLTTAHGPLDITFKPSGTDGYEDLARQATRLQIPGAAQPVLVASSKDIIRSKTAAGRAKDLAVLPALRAELDGGKE